MTTIALKQYNRMLELLFKGDPNLANYARYL